MRDDAPFGGPDPPAALFRYARDRSGDHPVEHLRTFAGILQADAYAGYRRLYEHGRSPGSVTEALCWSHGRRKFYEFADIAANKRRGKRAPPISPLALEAVKRIDVLFDIEREINGEPAERRLAVRQERSAPLVAELEEWMRMERAGLSRHAAVAKAMDYMLKRWGSFSRFLDDGRICLTNNAAERALRGICLGRKSWLFAGSDRGGVRAAVMYTLIGTAKLNDVDPQAWLADGVALGADIAGPRQVRQHLRKAHRQLPFQPAWLLRLLLSLAGPPPLAPPPRLRCLRLRRRLLPRFNRRRIPRDVLHQMAIHRPRNQRLMQTAGQTALGKLGKGPRKRRLARKPAGTAPAAQPA